MKASSSPMNFMSNAYASAPQPRAYGQHPQQSYSHKPQQSYGHKAPQHKMPSYDLKGFNNLFKTPFFQGGGKSYGSGGYGGGNSFQASYNQSSTSSVFAAYNNSKSSFTVSGHYPQVDKHQPRNTTYKEKSPYADNKPTNYTSKYTVSKPKPKYVASKPKNDYNVKPEAPKYNVYVAHPEQYNIHPS
jgi:hypothetical protein